MEKFWTTAKVDILKEEWAAGTNVRVIADMLGGSRNTIIGKAHRLELPIHAGSLFHPNARKKRTARKPKPKAKKRVRIRRMKASPPPCVPLPPPPPPGTAPDALRIPFADLERRHCRYSVSAEAPHFFCGHERQGKSAFCAFHHALCHEPRREKPRGDIKHNFARFYARAA